MGRRQVARLRFLAPPFVGSNPPAPDIKKKFYFAYKARTSVPFRVQGLLCKANPPHNRRLFLQRNNQVPYLWVVKTPFGELLEGTTKKLGC